jgi:hypothetical protein
MFLIEPLQYGIKLTKMFNGLEYRQLAFLLRKKYPRRNPEIDIDKLLRMNLLIEDDGSVFIPYVEPIIDIREPLRIMISLWKGNIIGFDKGRRPALLTFTRLNDTVVHQYIVCGAKNRTDKRLYEFDCIDNKPPTFIILTKNKNLECQFRDYVLAVKSDGRHKFYKNNLEVKKYEF